VESGAAFQLVVLSVATVHSSAACSRPSPDTTGCCRCRRRLFHSYTRSRPFTPQLEYFEAADNLTKWGFGGPGVTTVLASLGIETVQQLADAPLEAVLRLRDEADLHVPDICYHKKRAQQLTWRCSVRYRPYDTEFMKAVVPADGSAAPPVEEEADDGCLDVSASVSIAPKDVDVVCRQRWRARRSFGAAYMDGLLYVLGGFEGKGNYANDMWYRGA
jgi:hypothetical protein